jgi:hypothetical protein
MHESLQDIKLWLIQEISASEDAALLREIKTQVAQRKKRYLYEPAEREADANLRSLVSEPHLGYEIDLKKIMREQGYTTPDKDGLYKILEQMDVQEPVEEMLAFLTKRISFSTPIS